MDISLTGNDYKNYKGKLSSAMIETSDNSFTIIFQSIDAFNDSDNSNVESEKNIDLPLLIINYEDIIKSAIPNIRILYNGILNIETLLSGYILGKIYRNEDISKLSDLLQNSISDLLTDDKLNEDLKQLIDEAQDADDFDFSQLEDRMFQVIDEKITSLL